MMKLAKLYLSGFQQTHSVSESHLLVDWFDEASASILWNQTPTDRAATVNPGVVSDVNRLFWLALGMEVTGSETVLGSGEINGYPVVAIERGVTQLLLSSTFPLQRCLPLLQVSGSGRNVSNETDQAQDDGTCEYDATVGFHSCAG